MGASAPLLRRIPTTAGVVDTSADPTGRAAAGNVDVWLQTSATAGGVGRGAPLEPNACSASAGTESKFSSDTSN